VIGGCCIVVARNRGKVARRESTRKGEGIS
jgi:hypothetical protein